MASNLRCSLQAQLHHSPSVSICHWSLDRGDPGVGSLDLRLKHPQTGQLLGCYSPCSKPRARVSRNRSSGGERDQDVWWVKTNGTILG